MAKNITFVSNCMSEDNYNYTDNSFNAQLDVAYTLLMQVGPQSFDYAVLFDNRLIIYEEDRPLGDLLQAHNDEVLSARYKKAIIGFTEQGFTLIPDSIFKPEMAPKIARFLDVKPGDHVFFQQLDADNHIGYKVDEAVVSAVSTGFNINDSVFASKGWIKVIAKNNPAQSDIFVNVRMPEEKAEVLNVHNGKLYFYNSFSFKHPDELVYFISMVAAELKLDPQSIKLTVSGDIEKGDAQFKRLTDFFKTELDDLRMVDLPPQVEPHRLLSLTSLIQCV